MYYEGKGVLKDYTIAYIWFIFSKAQAHGELEAILGRWLHDLEDKMTSSQILKAQKLANQFKAEKTILEEPVN